MNYVYVERKQIFGFDEISWRKNATERKDGWILSKSYSLSSSVLLFLKNFYTFVKIYLIL